MSQAKSTLDDPAVPAEMLAGLDALSGDPRGDISLPASALTAAMIVRLVGVELLRPTLQLAAFATDGRDRIEHVLEGHAIVNIGSGQEKTEGNALAIRDEVTFRAETTPIRRV